mgnify:CR=1 FL=1
MNDDTMFPSVNWIETANLHGITLTLNMIPVPENEFQLKIAAMLMQKGIALIKEYFNECIENNEYPNDQYKLAIDAFAQSMLTVKLKIVIAARLDNYIIQCNTELLDLVSETSKKMLDNRLEGTDNVVKFPRNK